MAFVEVNGSNYPKVKLEWAPTTFPTDTPTFVDITDRWREFSWGYGRNDETSEFETGSGYVLLDNRDRKLDPSYAAGAWYGKLKPRRQFKITVQVQAGFSQFEFWAYARGFPQSWPSDGFDAVVRVDLVDGLAVLEGVDLAIGFSRPEETAGDRISAVLSAAGIPGGYVAVSTVGTVTVPAIEITEPGTSALAHIRQVTASEYGQFFVGRDNVYNFYGRAHRLNLAAAAFRDAVFTDAAAGGIHYDTEFQPVLDDNYLWNHAIVTGPNSEDVKGEASDAASEDEYHPIVKPVSSLLAFKVDRQALAEYYVYRFAQPAFRAPAITINGGGIGPAAPVLTYPHWAQLLTLDVNSIVTVKRFADTAAPMTFEQYVEGIRHTARPGGPWITTVTTSPADLTTYWVLEDATYGFIDTNGVLIAP